MKTPIERYVQQRNQESLDDFHGLSPEQMYRMLHFPFASPELVRLPEVLTTSPTAPIVTLFVMLLEAIGERGAPLLYLAHACEFCRLFWSGSGGACFRQALLSRVSGERFAITARVRAVSIVWVTIIGESVTLHRVWSP